MVNLQATYQIEWRIPLDKILHAIITLVAVIPKVLQPTLHFTAKNDTWNILLLELCHIISDSLLVIFIVAARIACRISQN